MASEVTAASHRICRRRRDAYLVGALHLAAEHAAIGGVDAQRLADELGEVLGGFLLIHGFSEYCKQELDSSSDLTRRRRGMCSGAVSGVHMGGEGHVGELMFQAWRVLPRRAKSFGRLQSSISRADRNQEDTTSTTMYSLRRSCRAALFDSNHVLVLANGSRRAFSRSAVQFRGAHGRCSSLLAIMCTG